MPVDTAWYCLRCACDVNPEDVVCHCGWAGRSTLTPRPDIARTDTCPRR